MGAILRNTVFHYNIKMTRGNDDNILEDHINDTIKLGENGKNQEMRMYRNQIMFDQPLHIFPFHFVAVYGICILIYLLLSVTYYRVFHPWKIIMWKKNSNEYIAEEVDSKSVSEHDGDEPEEEIPEVESSPEDEISQLWVFIIVILEL